MGQINKIDFFVGVFVSAILNSAKSVPALFDETNESKKVEFQTNLGYFNVYIKYSTNRKESVYDKRKQKKQYYWNIPFSEIENEKLRKFKKEGYQNYIVLVCTNDTLTKTWIVVLDYEKALRCLANTTPNGSRRIKVTRIGSSHEFYCQGVDYRDNEYERCLFDYTTYFEEASNSVPTVAES
jgi:hypothetical protein